MRRYTLNVNGWRGYLDIDIDNDDCHGEMRFFYDPQGNMVNQTSSIVNCTIDRSYPDSVIIEFDRDQTGGQHYKGWMGADGRIIAGYFSRDYRLGWYATQLC